MAVNTDKGKIKEILTRGVENIYPTPGFLEERLGSGKKITLYTGYDPTAPTLHIGHGITLLKLRQFQELGHKVIMLIGDFTGMIGDPTDKISERKQLTREQVLENCEEYQKQASAILNFTGENPVEIKYNSEWLSKMTFADVLELSAHFTVPRLLERDMFEQRLKEGKTVHLHEFMYPIMQGYDSVAMDVDGEVGGNDQTFNMLCGRDLLKSINNKEKFVLTMKLLTDNSGKKMGKTEGNMISLVDTPEDMFGKVMSWSDGMIINGFELCTAVNMQEVEKYKEEIDQGTNPRDIKLTLASEVVKTFLGQEAANKGKEHFSKVIQSKDMPDDIKEVDPSASDILTVLVEAELVSSRAEGRRSIDQGAVKVDNEKIGTYDYVVGSGNVVQKGKRFFVKVK